MREAIALAEAADSSQCGGSEAVAKMESVFRSWSTRNPDQSQDNGSDAHAAPRYRHEAIIGTHICLKLVTELQ